MANYPPPGQAHPDQPSDPWQEAPLWGGPTPAPYGEPSGYIGEQYSPAPPFPPPNPQQPGQPPMQVWGPPQPPNKPGLSATVIAIITAAAVVVLGGVVLGVYALSGDKTNNTPLGQTSSGTTATSKAPTASPTSSERDFRSAKIGDCMVNQGSFDKPDLHFADCDAQDAWRVVARFDGTDDESKCEGVANSEISYFYRRGSDSFVLCFDRL